uniref:Envelope protein n=1 Tax=Neogobius melanostomus TaxID=47308 RepID=A0A8C6SQ21_9GOBI
MDILKTSLQKKGCYLWMVICGLSVVSVMIVIPVLLFEECLKISPEVVNKRYVDRGEIMYHYQANMWWRYINYTAHLTNNTDCYVCTHLPVSTTHTGIYATTPNDTQILCLVALSIHPGQWRDLASGDMSVPAQLPKEGLLKDTPCHAELDLLTWPQLGDPLVMEDIIEPHDYIVCYTGNGTTNVGHIEKNHCRNMLTFCPPIDEPTYYACLNNDSCWQDTQAREAAKVMNKDFALWCATSLGCRCSRVAPITHVGTRVLSDWYWLCGHAIYTNLPPHWGGTCTIVELHQPIMYIPKDKLHTVHETVQTANRRRGKRDVLFDRGVPYDQRIFNTGQRIAMALFPNFGISDLRTEVEYNRWRLLGFMNTTIVAFNATNEELKALRTMVLQNRVVLDLLTASTGGVCAQIGTGCCTFIPDNSGDGGLITQAIKDMVQARDEVQ